MHVFTNEDELKQICIITTPQSKFQISFKYNYALVTITRESLINVGLMVVRMITVSFVTIVYLFKTIVYLTCIMSVSSIVCMIIMKIIYIQ